MSASQSGGGTRRWPAIALGMLLIAALAFAIGRFSTFGDASASVNTPTTESAEAGFARDMQVHHAQAIQLAMEIYRKTDDVELRSLAYDIATGQSAQKGEMYDWLVSWGLPQAGGPMMAWMNQPAGGHDHGGAAATPLTDAQARKAMGMATDAEVTSLEDATGKNADCLFLTLMIRHHEGAIPMADAAIRLASTPRVIAVAKSMKTGQSAEIDAMRSIQQRFGCTG